MSTFPMSRRLVASTTDSSGGNPAGVWVGDELPSAEEMQRIAAEVGSSETMGRPSLLRVDVPASGGVTVTGAAVSLEPEPLEAAS